MGEGEIQDLLNSDLQGGITEPEKPSQAIEASTKPKPTSAMEVEPVMTTEAKAPQPKPSQAMEIEPAKPEPVTVGQVK